MAEKKYTAPTPLYRLILKSYPADRKVTVIKVVRDINRLGLKEVKDLVENLPAVVAEFKNENAAKVADMALTDCAAECTVDVIGAEADLGDAADDLPSRVILAASESLEQYAQDRWQRARELSDLLRLVAQDQDDSFAIGHIWRLAEELSASMDPLYYRRAQEGASVKELLRRAHKDAYGDELEASDVTEAQS